MDRKDELPQVREAVRRDNIVIQYALAVCKRGQCVCKQTAIIPTKESYHEVCTSCRHAAGRRRDRDGRNVERSDLFAGQRPQRLSQSVSVAGELGETSAR